MTNTFIRVISLSLLLCASNICLGQDAPKWVGNLSFSISHGLNYHFDGNKTRYWDEYGDTYHTNRNTSLATNYKIAEKFAISVFREKFSGLYQDSASLYNEELIFARSGTNIGLRISYQTKLSEKWTVSIGCGATRRKGYELYALAFHGIAEAQFSTVELLDIGISSELVLNYKIGKGFSIFALTDYTRFVYLKSDESGEKDFYDGPTRNYVRTRLGIQYSLSHILRTRE